MVNMLHPTPGNAGSDSLACSGVLFSALIQEDEWVPLEVAKSCQMQQQNQKAAVELSIASMGGCSLLEQNVLQRASPDLFYLFTYLFLILLEKLKLFLKVNF